MLWSRALEPFADMPYLTVAGERAHYVEWHPTSGTAAPAILIHGAGGTHQHWLYQVRDLPSSPTIALDLPGHGRSEGEGRDSISAYGDWIVDFLDAVGVEQAVLVGHSMGGGIALDVALRHPSRVAGLGLVATGARLRVAPAILDGIRQNTDAAVALISRWAFGPEAPEEMVHLARLQMGQTPGEVFYGDFVACDTFDVTERLAEITVPAIVMCGTGDKMTPSKYAVYLRDHMANTGLHLIEGAGHMIMIERPQDVTQALSGFLATL